MAYLMEGDSSLHAVRKTKYRFALGSRRFEIDVYPFSADRAIMFAYGDDKGGELPEGIEVIREVTGDVDYKNRALAKLQRL